MHLLYDRNANFGLLFVDIVVTDACFLKHGALGKNLALLFTMKTAMLPSYADKNTAFEMGLVPCCMYQYLPVYFLIQWA